MSEIKRKNIHEIISSITENQTINFFLIISYEFDFNQFFNLFELDESEQIAIIQQIKPIAIFDAKNTSSCMSYAKWVECHTQNKNYSCHHSKAYCVITENSEIHLILGSANFTEQGLFHNREVLEYFCWNPKKTENLNILAEWIEFLNLDPFYRPENDKQEKCRFNLFCEELQKLYRKINSKQHRSPKKSEYFLLHSGYNKKGLEKLKSICEEINLIPTTLYVVSPFFDTNSEENICNDFINTFPKLNRIHVCTDVKNYLTIHNSHFNAIDKQTFYSIAPGIDDAEYNHIKEINDCTVKKENIIRHLHAKILLLSDGKKGICYIGSANFTQNAWLGKNNELGIVKKINKPKELWEEIFNGLYATDKNKITFSPSSENKDNDKEERNLFPEFIDYIALKVKKEKGLEQQWITNNDKFYFTIYINKEKLKNNKSIEDYTVTWNDEKINFKHQEGNHINSEDIKSDKWADLLLRDSCTLCFKINNKNYYIPFNYDRQILAQPELISQKSSNDILLSYIGKRTQGQSNPDGENINISDKENDNNTPSEELKEIRKSNPIIEMQEYLKRFGEFENAIRQSIKNKKTEETTIKKELENAAELARVLSQEYQKENKNKEATLFKLGEIYYFIKQEEKFVPYSKEILDNIKKLIQQIQPGNQIETNYIQFIFGK